MMSCYQEFCHAIEGVCHPPKGFVMKSDGFSHATKKRFVCHKAKGFL